MALCWLITKVIEIIHNSKYILIIELIRIILTGEIIDHFNSELFN